MLFVFQVWLHQGVINEGVKLKLVLTVNKQQKKE